MADTTPAPALEEARRLDVSPRDAVTAPLLAWFITAGFLGVIAMLLFRDLPERSRDILNILLGILGGNVNTVIGYYFGASASNGAMQLRRTVPRPALSAPAPPAAVRQEGMTVVSSSSP